MVGPDCFEDSKNTHRIHICREFRGIEADLNVTLGCKIVYLRGLDKSDQLDERHRITHICIVQMEVRLALEMSDSFAEIDRGTADNAVNLISFLEKELAQIRAVLTCYTCYKCYFSVHIILCFR